MGELSGIFLPAAPLPGVKPRAPPVIIANHRRSLALGVNMILGLSAPPVGTQARCLRGGACPPGKGDRLDCRGFGRVSPR